MLILERITEILGCPGQLRNHQPHVTSEHLSYPVNVMYTQISKTWHKKKKGEKTEIALLIIFNQLLIEMKF